MAKKIISGVFLKQASIQKKLPGMQTTRKMMYFSTEHTYFDQWMSSPNLLIEAIKCKLPCKMIQE